jgi:ferredoxin
MELYCLTCIVEIASGNQEGEPEPAVTLVPSWQTQTSFGQVMMACVAVPTCRGHITITKKSPAERTLGSGLIIPTPVVDGNG